MQDLLAFLSEDCCQGRKELCVPIGKSPRARMAEPQMAEATAADALPHVLFLCSRNSARSQMAEGFARAMAGMNINIYSAGVDPSAIDDHAVDVMEEVGIDISKQSVQPFDKVPMSKIDTVITLSSDADPLPKNLRKKATQIHWPLNDPAATSGSDAEVTRPLRVQALTQALSAAFARLETAQQTPSPSTASLAQPVTPSDPPDGAQAGATSARVYRGQRY